MKRAPSDRATTKTNNSRKAIPIRVRACRSKGVSIKSAPRALRLIQARAAEAFKIVLPVRVLLNRYLVSDPGKGNIGLSAAKLLQCRVSEFGRSGHAGRGGEDPVGAGVVAAQTDG